jgi:hypothetical protein
MVKHDNIERCCHYGICYEIYKIILQNMHRVTNFFKKCEQNSIISFQFSVATDRRNLTV